jgi:uncharacterized protein involved in exopolysaccharide biosynthesis
MQISTWTFGRITLACVAIGVLASVAISFTWPAQYISEAKIKIVPEQVPESNVLAATNKLIWNRVLSICQEVRSPRVLTAIIQQHNLYPRERNRMPIDDVVEIMHKNILLAPLVPARSPNRVVPAFVVEFGYPDPHLAQQVTADLMSRFIEASLREHALDHLKPHFGRLEPLDVASLPTHPSGRNEAMLVAAAVGLFAGLLAGLALALVIRSRRRLAV